MQWWSVDWREGLGLGFMPSPRGHDMHRHGPAELPPGRPAPAHGHAGVGSAGQPTPVARMAGWLQGGWAPSKGTVTHSLRYVAFHANGLAHRIALHVKPAVPPPPPRGSLQLSEKKACTLAHVDDEACPPRVKEGKALRSPGAQAGGWALDDDGLCVRASVTGAVRHAHTGWGGCRRRQALAGRMAWLGGGGGGGSRGMSALGFDWGSIIITRDAATPRTAQCSTAPLGIDSSPQPMVSELIRAAAFCARSLNCWATAASTMLVIFFGEGQPKGEGAVRLRFVDCLQVGMGMWCRFAGIFGRLDGLIPFTCQGRGGGRPLYGNACAALAHACVLGIMLWVD